MDGISIPWYREHRRDLAILVRARPSDLAQQQWTPI